MNEADPAGSAAPAPATATEADFATCEREPIHQPGLVQPFGLLLFVSEPDGVVLQASANAAAMLGYDKVVGKALRDLGGDLAGTVLPRTLEPLDGVPAVLTLHAGADNAAFDAVLHRPPGGGLIIELEPALPQPHIARQVETALHAFLSCYALKPLCDEAARVFRDLTGYDRVMVFLFAQEGHGEVYAEERRPDLEAYLGNRYPASDIPQVARRLYVRTRVRVTADVGYTPVPVEPLLNPLTGGALDMSLCLLRSISPSHIQFLKNMKVGASLVCSILVGGQLRGLVACHHDTPRRPAFALRGACDLLAEALGTRIAALEAFVQSQAELSARRLEQRLVEAMSRKGDWQTALFDNPLTLLQPIGATGAALLFEGGVQTAGDVPGTDGLRELATWLDSRPRGGPVATNALRDIAPQLASLTPVAAGVLAVPISDSPGEYLVWFRHEQPRTVVWGGDPRKSVEIQGDRRRLLPRASFAKWFELVEGSAEPWSPADLATARLVGDSVADAVVQFRAVRLLIAEDQLAQVRRQVAASSQPLVICDAEGAIGLMNAAMERLLPALQGARPRHVEELARFFASPGEVRRRLMELIDLRQSWSGDVRLADDDEGGRPVTVRADPVVAAQDRVLGFVLMFNDLGQRKAADAARRRFQEAIAESHRSRAGWLDRQADLGFQAVLAAVVENAQLAALEIAEGIEIARMPAMLESVRASVTRTTEVLEILARQLGAPKPGGGGGAGG
jgi:light-regulated signal transduction histidine kinase (bacteriophytochrome)